MVGPINNGYLPQAPITNTFKPGQQASESVTDKNAPTVNIAQQTTAKSTGAINQVNPSNETTNFARNNVAEDSGNVSTGSDRGTTIDISA